MKALKIVICSLYRLEVFQSETDLRPIFKISSFRACRGGTMPILHFALKVVFTLCALLTFYGIVSNFVPLCWKVHTWNYHNFHLTKDRLTQKRHRVVTLGEKNASLVLQQNLVAQRLFVLEIVGWGGLELESENKN